MKIVWFSLYSLVLALWVGGISIFTFVVTPIIFRSYPRDMAGDIVGKLFPPYFSYSLTLSVLALILFFMLARDQSNLIHRLSIFLLTAAIVINVFIMFKLHPETVIAKEKIASFERVSPDAPERKKFSKLHGLSAVLNLLLLADGVTLLVVSPLIKR
jgi:hypothetical protein